MLYFVNQPLSTGARLTGKVSRARRQGSIRKDLGVMKLVLCNCTERARKTMRDTIKQFGE
jgi:hypothetical protein